MSNYSLDIYFHHLSRECLLHQTIRRAEHFLIIQMKYESLEAKRKNDVPGPPTILYARATEAVFFLFPSLEIGLAQDLQMLLLQIILAHMS